MKININSGSDLYAVIGDPIHHSMSPIIHNSFFNKRNMDKIYISLLVKKDNLKNEVEFLRNNLKGFNVTIPHKETIIPYLDHLDPLALEYGAVNTVKVIDGKLIGHNTDGWGFMKSLHSINVSLENKNVLLLGSGGAGRVAAFEILRAGGNLTIATRNINSAEDLKRDLLKFHSATIDTIQINEVNGSFDIIVNSTPVGMHPNIDESPVDEKFLQGSELLYDMTYNPYESKFLSLGKKAGAKTINGLPMLLHQGLRSLEIWTGESSTTEEEDYIFELLKASCSSVKTEVMVESRTQKRDPSS